MDEMDLCDFLFVRGEIVLWKEKKVQKIRFAKQKKGEIPENSQGLG